ncbi:MAG: hypothetical protein RR782_02805 [Clostridium sp.]
MKVELVLPKDRTLLNDKLAEVMAEITCKKLNPFQISKSIELLENSDLEEIKL